MGAGKLRIICGPTAAGKSAIALELAEKFGGAIISADSRQVYRKFDIGTAKPTVQERSRVPHHGIDVIDPTLRYSAAAWADAARSWIASARGESRIPVVVGGTGLYVKALVEPLFAAPEVDGERREALMTELESRSIDDLRRWCEQLDPARAHLGRTQLLRAIEMAILTGKRISDLHAIQRNHSPPSPPFDVTYLVVDPGKALGQRIVTRVDQMMDRGWRDEVESLSKTVPPDAPAWKASGYSVMRSLASGDLDLSKARERVIIETRQYAKRQRTWFRHQLPPAAVTDVNPDDPALTALVREWWEKAE